jgi:hypothetical protein
MARCRECSAKVWRNAEYCEHCGVRYPAKGYLLTASPDQVGGKSYFRGVIIIGVVVIIAVGLNRGGNGVATTAPSCKANWTLCTDNADLVNNYLESDHTAQVDCQIQAAQYAKYGDPKFPSFAFDTYHVGNDYVRTGIAALIEPNAQFQNGFGAMVHSEVTCTYDLRAKRVVDINIAPK